jgi:hypothetical protein
MKPDDNNTDQPNDPFGPAPPNRQDHPAMANARPVKWETFVNLASPPPEDAAPFTLGEEIKPPVLALLLAYLISTTQTVLRSLVTPIFIGILLFGALYGALGFIALHSGREAIQSISLELAVAVSAAVVCGLSVKDYLFASRAYLIRSLAKFVPRADQKPISQGFVRAYFGVLRWSGAIAFSCETALLTLGFGLASWGVASAFPNLQIFADQSSLSPIDATLFWAQSIFALVDGPNVFGITWSSLKHNSSNVGMGLAVIAFKATVIGTVVRLIHSSLSLRPQDLSDPFNSDFSLRTETSVVVFVGKPNGSIGKICDELIELISGRDRVFARLEHDWTVFGSLNIPASSPRQASRSNHLSKAVSYLAYDTKAPLRNKRLVLVDASGIEGWTRDEIRRLSEPGAITKAFAPLERLIGNSHVRVFTVAAIDVADAGEQDETISVILDWLRTVRKGAPSRGRDKVALVVGGARIGSGANKHFFCDKKKWRTQIPTAAEWAKCGGWAASLSPFS